MHYAFGTILLLSCSIAVVAGDVDLLDQFFYPLRNTIIYGIEFMYTLGQITSPKESIYS